MFPEVTREPQPVFRSPNLGRDLASALTHTRIRARIAKAPTEAHLCGSAALRAAELALGFRKDVSLNQLETTGNVADDLAEAFLIVKGVNQPTLRWEKARARVADVILCLPPSTTLAGGGGAKTAGALSTK